MFEVRSGMVITGMTDAPILWPVGKHGPGRHSLIVYKGLAKAIRRESNQAKVPNQVWPADLTLVERASRPSRPSGITGFRSQPSKPAFAHPAGSPSHPQGVRPISRTALPRPARNRRPTAHPSST